MPSINTITNWFRYSQIEYFTPFMKLWLAFNSWYKQFLPSVHTDRDAIDSIKVSGPIKDNFERKIGANGDEEDELRKSLSVLIREVRFQKITSESGNSIGFDQSDIDPDFHTRSSRSKAGRLSRGNLIRLDEDTVATSDKAILFQEALEVIYQIRCHLIHGELDIDNQRAQRLIKSAFIILNIIFGPAVSSP